jgi:S-adenosyl methyltransferase
MLLAERNHMTPVRDEGIMGRPKWAPEPINLEVPSAARVWDYFLGGSHNFAVDRQVADAAIAMKPDMPQLARAVRLFLRRAVETIARAGGSQFLDIGAGIPTVGNVHEVAARIDPDVKVAYVDHDPVAVTHGRALLEGNERVIAVHGDARFPKEVLLNSEVCALLDFDRPIGLLMCGLLHFVPDAFDPAAIVAELLGALAPGSYLMVQHATHDAQPEATIKMLEMWNANSPEPMYWRSRERITAFFDGLTLLEPGVVFLPEWGRGPDEAPDPQPERFASYAALGRKD